jgi:hypothetical protein
MELVTATTMRIGKWMMAIYVISKINFQVEDFSLSQAKGPISKFLADRRRRAWHDGQRICY